MMLCRHYSLIQKCKYKIVLILKKKKVYKFINAVTNKNQNIIFDIGEDNSTASLESKENSSIYNAELK